MIAAGLQHIQSILLTSIERGIAMLFACAAMMGWCGTKWPGWWRWPRPPHPDPEEIGSGRRCLAANPFEERLEPWGCRIPAHRAEKRERGAGCADHHGLRVRAHHAHINPEPEKHETVG